MRAEDGATVGRRIVRGERNPAEAERVDAARGGVGDVAGEERGGVLARHGVVLEDEE